MAEISFPLDNVRYSAEEFQLYMSTRNSGIYAKEDFEYSLAGGMNLIIGKGRAWLKYGEFNGLAYGSTTAKELKFAEADPLLPRIDRVVIQYNRLANTVTMQVKTGIASNSPKAVAIQKNSDIYELCLYQVKVVGGSNTITASDIIDERLDENLCGLMGDSVTKINTAHIDKSIKAFLTDSKNNIAKLQEEEKALFETWFSNIKNMLDGDIAGNLASKIQTNTKSIETNTKEIQTIKTKYTKKDEVINFLSNGITYKKITLGSSSYDKQNLYTTKVLDTGNIFWIDEKSQVYSIERQENNIVLFSNTELKNKTLNIISIKNSDMLVFVGLVQKTSKKTLYFNKENIDMWQRWTNKNAIINIYDDRINIVSGNIDSCEIQFATKEIDISTYSTIRLYASSTRVNDSFGTMYEAKFGIYKKGLDMKKYQDNEFVACTLATNIKDYKDLDISQINGKYMIGIGGKMQGEIYKMELM